MKISFLFYFSIYFSLSFLLILSSSKKVKNSKNKQELKSKEKLKYDDISSIYQWAQKNGIYINNNLQLYKNSENDLDHNFYYFKTNKTIKNNSLLLSVPSSIMISQESLEKMHKKGKNKKLANLWNKVININKYLNYSSSKQLFYISVMLSDATFKQKGKFYKKYEEYLNMYDYINLDDYPIFFKANEVVYLNSSNFGKEIINNYKAINNEYDLINHELEMDSTVIVEEFIKYRILSIANSIYYKNKSYIVPFIDCFQKKVNLTHKEYNAYVRLNISNQSNHGFNINIYTNRTIKKNKEISILWKLVSNIENYLYYGFVDENNMIIPPYLVEFVNKNFLKDLNVDLVNKKNKINFEDLIEPKYYDLSDYSFDRHLLDKYRNYSLYFDKYSHSNEGPYVMMKDNLQYYLDIYKELYNDELINRNIEGINKKKYVRNVLNMERKLIEEKINALEAQIVDIANNKEERDIYELLRRSFYQQQKNKKKFNFKD